MKKEKIVPLNKLHLFLIFLFLVRSSVLVDVISGALTESLNTLAGLIFLNVRQIRVAPPHLALTNQ